MDQTKEVRFDIYCRQCKYRDKLENEEPCADCLNYGANTDSHKPVRFVAGRTKHVKRRDHREKDPC